MFSALVKSLAQLPERPFRRVVLLGVVGALLIYLALNAAIWWALLNVGYFQEGWVDTTIGVLGGVAATVLTLIFFPAVVTIIVGVLLDDIARAVEARHYPRLPPARERPMIEDLATTFRLAGLCILVNMLALPFYLLLMATGLGIVAFYAVNGYLLGREYFDLVALRRLTRPQATLLRRTYRVHIWLAGAGVTFLLSLPVINLLAPVIATAFMVHVFETLRQRQPFV